MKELAMDPMQVRLEALKLSANFIIDMNSRLPTRDFRGSDVVIRVASQFEKYISEGQVQ